MGERVLIAFIPQKRVIDNLQKIRKIAGINIEKSSGLKTPHITIIDDSYSNVKEVDKELKKIAKITKPFLAKIKGIDTFVVKKDLRIERYKENNSLVYLIKNNPQMNQFRKEIYKKLASLKTGERLKQWKKENLKMPKKVLENIEKYGTPFEMNEWKFHTTIGLIPKTKQKEILKKIEKLNLSGNWTIDHFGLFVRKNGWVLFKKYSFNFN